MATSVGRRFCVSTVANIAVGHSRGGVARLGGRVGFLGGANASRRAIHGSPVVLKKKSKVVIEDLFSEETESAEDLLSDPATAPSSKTMPVAATKAPASPAAKESYPSKHLTPAKRQTLFEEHYNSLLPHLNVKDVKERRKLSPIKYSVWTTLLQLAQSDEELRRVMELIPKWRDSKRHLNDKGGLAEQWSELFVSRAENLSCPTVALELFSHHAKYQVPLSLPAARALLHALHEKHSTEHVMTAVALYRVYGLPPIADDLVSLGLVCRSLAGQVYPIQKPPAPASSSSESETLEPIPASTRTAAKQVLDALLVSLRQLLSNTNPSLYSVSPHARTRALTPSFQDRWEKAEQGLPAKEKEKTWLKWCLARIEKSISNVEGSDGVKWLRAWREQAGHAKAEVTASA